MRGLRIVRLARCGQRELEHLLTRSELMVDSVLPQVVKIVSEVLKEGDGALLKYTRRFDGVKLAPGTLRVGEGEFRLAFRQVDSKTRESIERAANAIRRFHVKQMPRQWMIRLAPGVRAGQLVRPLDSVGVYVPGGLARYPSSLLMAAIPAKVAGVGQVMVCTPPEKDGTVNAAVLVAARIAGADAVFKAGGAQAIAAMAYGTESIPKVDKIVGPGNLYVMAAKQVVSSVVDVDFAAGPSEILIIADGSADANLVAVDMLSQAEHGPDAAAVLVTTSEKLALRVRELIFEMVKGSQRRDVVLRSLTKYGRIVVAENMEEAVEFANAYAPEHLELMVKNPSRILNKIRNAGGIFLGSFSPVAAGDLAVGPNHILPTGGMAKRRSGLSVLDFVRLPTVQELSRDGLRRLAPVVERLAEVERLPGHARSIRERLKEV